jgi:hypothetical protein
VTVIVSYTSGKVQDIDLSSKFEMEIDKLQILMGIFQKQLNLLKHPEGYTQWFTERRSFHPIRIFLIG